MSKISFVYFDVGGVAIQDFSDSPKWKTMMDDMGIPESRQNEFDELYSEYDTAICLGQHEDTLLPEIISRFNLSLPDDFSMRKYFLDNFNKNTDLWPIFKKVKTTKKIGLLTDIYPNMLNEIFARGLLPKVGYWDVIIDSSVEGVRKPNPEIYKLATSKAGVPPEEILFIDNRQKNIDEAISAGWQTFLYDSSNYPQANHDLDVYLQPQGL